MTSSSWKNEINYPDYDCKKCNQSKCWIVGYFKDSGGADKYPYVCYNCGTKTQHYVKRKLVELNGLRPENVSSNIPPYFCEVCNAEGA